MICEVCNKIFVPTNNETRCLECEIEAWREKQPNTRNIPEAMRIYRFDGNTLYAVVFKTENFTKFIKLPPPPRKVQSFVSTDYNEFTESNIKILTNYTKDTTEIKDYFFTKIPQFVDSVTGTDYIFVPKRSIRKIHNNKMELEDGYVRTYFG